MNNNFLSPKQVAEKLGVSTITIMRLISSKKIIAHKVGHRIIRIPQESFNDFIQGSTMGVSATQTNNEQKI